MTTEKQLEANRQNAQFSSGPTTVTGKAIVAQNAIKHGIFSKDLILSSDIENENEDEYQEIFNNLFACLSPGNQIESLLVEKIAVDFWRLRRIIRFETGSIVQSINQLLKEAYSYGNKSSEDIDEEIRYKQQLIAWNVTYLECLAEGKVTFDQPVWKDGDFESDVIQDFYFIGKSIDSLTKGEKDRLYGYDLLTFKELQDLLLRYGYVEAQEISAKLIEIYSKQNQRCEEEIQKLTRKKLTSGTVEKLTYMLGMIPPSDNTEKVLKYERSLQKSIYQNLIMLKKLQGLF